MLKVMDINRNKVAYLENAYSVAYEKQTNKIGSASFSLPLDDPKVEKVKQLKFIEITDTDGEYIGLYRVMPTETTVSESTQSITFELRHVLSLLLDSVIFGYKEISPNTNTRDTITYLLSLQKTKHWQLGKCEFTRYFQYSWENVNGLVDAIWSVPMPFDEEYMWTFDTETYPWTLNLIKPPTTPTCLIQEGYNLKGFRIKSNPNQLINRIYPLGQGEGINQLKINKVNPTGKTYVEDAASIVENGLIEYIWADRRFTDALSLYSSAQALLKKWKNPIVSWEIDAVDLIKAIAKIPGQKIPKITELREGKVVRVKTNKFGAINLRILKESKSDMFNDSGSISLSIGYVSSDLGTTQADIERKIEINQLYSQGATNILNYDKADNADSEYPVVFRIFIDNDVVKINTCELTFETSAFRAYSKAIEGGGAVVSSTSAGGSVSKSTNSGGDSVQSTTSQAAGQSTNTSSANGSHRHSALKYVRDVDRETGSVGSARIYEAYGSGHYVMLYSVAMPGDIVTSGAADNHTHSVTTPAHTHNVSITIPNHSHDFTIPAHTHDITLPNHTHKIEYGIFEDSEKANQVELVVDGNEVPGTNTNRERFNLVNYLSKQEDGTINRGWHEIAMKPNKRARIEAQITMRVFIKSQIGGEF